MRHPCYFGIERIIKIIRFQNWHLENWFQLRGTCAAGTDIISNGSQNRWADSYNSFPIRSIQTKNLTVDPVSQGVEFILQIAMHVREPNELERQIVLAGCSFTG